MTAKPAPKAKKKGVEYQWGLKAAVKAVRTQFGEKPLFMTPNRRYIPMRHAGLAHLLGGRRHPGLPTGAFLEVLGQEHSGKTSLTFAMIQAVITQPPGKHKIHTETGVEELPVPRKVLVLDWEQTLDLDYLKSAVPEAVFLDVDEETGAIRNLSEANVLVHQPDTLDEGCDIMLHMIYSGEIGLVVGDSIAAMLTEEEKSKPMGENTMGLVARQMGKLFRKSAHVIRRYGVTVVFINQWRDKIGFVLGDPRTAPGGKASRYFDAIRLDVSGPTKTPWFPGEGKTVVVKAMKNKISGEKASCVYHLRNGWGISAEVELYESLRDRGLIKERSRGVEFNTPSGPRKFPSKLAMVEAMRSSPKLFNALASAAVKRGIVEGGYVPAEAKKVVGWEDLS